MENQKNSKQVVQVNVKKAQPPQRRVRKPNKGSTIVNRVERVENQMIHLNRKIDDVIITMKTDSESNSTVEASTKTIIPRDTAKYIVESGMTSTEYSSMIQDLLLREEALREGLNVERFSDPNKELAKFVEEERKGSAAMLDSPEFFEELESSKILVSEPVMAESQLFEDFTFDLLQPTDPELNQVTTNYWRANQSQVVPLIYNRFPIVYKGPMMTEVTVGAAVRSTVALKYKGREIQYFAVNDKYGRLYYFGVHNFDNIGIFVKGMEGILNQVAAPTRTYFTLVSDIEFTDYSWMLAMRASVQGMAVKALLTGALLLNSYFPGKVEEKLAAAKAAKEILIVSGDAEDTIEAYQTNWIYSQSGNFFYENKIINPVVVDTFPIVLLFNFIQIPRHVEKPVPVLTEFTGNAPKVKYEKEAPKPSKADNASKEDISDLSRRFQNLKAEADKAHYPGENMKAINAKVSLLQSLEFEGKVIPKSQYNSLYKTWTGLSKSVSDYSDAQKAKKQKGPAPEHGEGYWLSEGDKLKYKGKQYANIRKKIIEKNKKIGKHPPDDYVPGPQNAAPKVKQQSKFARFAGQGTVVKRAAPVIEEDFEESDEVLNVGGM